LRKLVDALPQYRDQLVSSITAEFPDAPPDLFRAFPLDERLEIPSACYKEVLEAAATLSGALRFLTVFDHLLTYATQQLDPERLGLSILVVQCMRPSPSGKEIYSLREQFRIGTPPWRYEREERNFFLGSESLAGYTISTCRSYEIDDVRTYTGFLPVHKVEYETSIATCPILRMGKVAGCLVVSSTQPNYFIRARTKLIYEYAHLAMEAFSEDQFYDMKDISLRLMPGADVQEPFLHLFNKHVEDLLARGEVTNRLLAEQIVLHRIEDDLIYWRSTHTPIVSTQ
jgi:hypothetical protein